MLDCPSLGWLLHSYFNFSISEMSCVQSTHRMDCMRLGNESDATSSEATVPDLENAQGLVGWLPDGERQTPVISLISILGRSHVDIRSSNGEGRRRENEWIVVFTPPESVVQEHGRELIPGAFWLTAFRTPPKSLRTASILSPIFWQIIRPVYSKVSFNSKRSCSCFSHRSGRTLIPGGITAARRLPFRFPGRRTVQRDLWQIMQQTPLPSRMKRGIVRARWWFSPWMIAAMAPDLSRLGSVSRRYQRFSYPCL